MAAASLSPGLAPAKPDIFDEMKKYQISGCTSLALDPLEHASQLLEAVHAWTIVLSEGIDPDNDGPTNRVSTTVLRSALDGISHCVALADFMLAQHEPEAKA